MKYDVRIVNEPTTTSTGSCYTYIAHLEFVKVSWWKRAWRWVRRRA